MKHKRLIQLSIIIGLLAGFYINSYGAQIEYFNQDDVSRGVIHITYKGTASKKVKVMIEKGDKKYTYDINAGGKTESFPLQLGNGTYKVKILENTTGTSYRIVASQNVEVKLQEDNIVFLNAIQNINWSVDMQAVKNAVELTKKTKDLQEKAKLLYSHMVDQYVYDYNKLAKLPSTYLPVIDTTFLQKKGICYDFSSLYAAMLRSQGIPSKLIKGYTPNAEGYHAWNEVYDSSKKEWLIIDTTYDLQVIKSKPKVKMIKSEKEYQKVNEY
ncbi:transglutaminase-like domain-containing protein [Cellulosilyticum sp. I15G10I2]|uniref:transglutaminase-like domain-containing protein n=1 Tax=Cellulosilyticum sp. I15G10I2 TaxID=1892843 RepID=UPI00085BD154|nr:transglutaminase-like domain-containing protein [Cellulosilyticum sp. I15G10I2]